MTMGTSTGAEPGGAGVPSAIPVPAWLPDEATMNRLAGEFFSSLPGDPTSTGSPVGALAATPGVPGGPTATPTPPEGFDTSPPRVPTASAPTAPIAAESPSIDAMPYADATASYDRIAADVLGLPVPNAPASRPEATTTQPGYYFLREPAPASTPNFYFLDSAAAPRQDVARHPAWDVEAIRRDFPILSEQVNGHPLAWFDNAATTQKPQAVIDRLAYYYAHENSNIHRAAHELAARSTEAFENARRTVARFIGASSADEIVFVRGATEAINLVAQTWGRKNIHSGDEIVISHLEHHANIVPWHMLAAETGAVLKVIPVDESGQLLMDEYSKLLSDRTKLVSVAQVSNALGTITPVADIAAQAHRAGATVLVDGAQSVPHQSVDVRALGADLFVFSGHKLFGPTGIGVLYGTSEILRDMPPWQGGGNMISDVTLERSTYQPAPTRFEAGTGNIADAIGLAAAIDYVERLGMDNIAAYEHSLLDYATAGLAAVPGLRLVGTAPDKASVLSFVLAGYEPLEVGQALDQKGIAVRAGHHCAQPILRRYGLEATVRPSLAFYNTCAEIDRMLAALHQLSSDAGRRPYR